MLLHQAPYTTAFEFVGPLERCLVCGGAGGRGFRANQRCPHPMLNVSATTSAAERAMCDEHVPAGLPQLLGS